MKSFSTLLTIIIILIFRTGFCQESLNFDHYPIIINKETPKKNNLKSSLFSKNIFNNTEFGLMFGATQFYGDIKQLDFRPSYSRFFDEIKPAYEMSIQKKINPLISLKTSYITGKFGGIKSEQVGDNYNSYDPYNFYENDGEYFVTSFNELDFQVLINLSNVNSFFSNINLYNFDIYLKSGIGLNVFNSLNRNFNGNYIYSYGYKEGVYLQNNNFSKKSLLNSPKDIVYVLGLNSSYTLNDKYKIHFDITKRKSNTDYWDSHSNNANNDFFNYYSFGVSYKILNKQMNSWRTPMKGLEKEIQLTTANIRWLSADSDNDGVSDAFDKELNTPIGVSVDGSGSALDIDMDNVPDYLDEDPFSTIGAIVNNKGVEFDSDNDGIPDSKDLENNTAPGSIVNKYGVSVSVINNSSDNNSYLPSIYFESGSFFINNSNLKRLSTVAMMLKNNDKIRLMVIGNTDQYGDADYNKELATKRALSVINYLSKNFRIDKNRFEYISNGEEKPLSLEVSSNEFPRIKTLSEVNRRVDFKIIK